MRTIERDAIDVLARVVASIALFLEFGDVVDDDAAVRAAENVAFELQSLSEDQQKVLSKAIGELAEGARAATFLTGLPVALGSVT